MVTPPGSHIQAIGSIPAAISSTTRNLPFATTSISPPRFNLEARRLPTLGDVDVNGIDLAILEWPDLLGVRNCFMA